ncbi:MAG TPA: hypothetical protein GXX35_11900 [Thermoanaerobacterales bacterium]|nr:hypothetical protein [Thermoanaerobacterales bacterium]
MELLTINKTLPRQVQKNLQEPVVLVHEIKKIVRELKEKNPILRNYKLMDVGLPDKNQKTPRMNLYFIKNR